MALGGWAHRDTRAGSAHVPTGATGQSRGRSDLHSKGSVVWTGGENLGFKVETLHFPSPVTLGQGCSLWLVPRWGEPSQLCVDRMVAREVLSVMV